MGVGFLARSSVQSETRSRGPMRMQPLPAPTASYRRLDRRESELSNLVPLAPRRPIETIAVARPGVLRMVCRWAFPEAERKPRLAHQSLAEGRTRPRATRSLLRLLRRSFHLGHQTSI